MFACGSTTKTSESAEVTTTETPNKMTPQEMIQAGYLEGTIMFSDVEGDCPYTIRMKGDKMEFYYLDPINLEESFKKDGKNVWIKFTGLRQMNRCPRATPIEINDIKKRDK